MENLAMDDTALLLRYARRPTEADFAELVRRHLPGIYSSALRRVGGDAQMAEDVVKADAGGRSTSYPLQWSGPAPRPDQSTANSVISESREDGKRR